MKNREIAKVLNDIADIMELKEIEWKPRAYREAARKINNMSEDIEEIYKKSGVKGLKDLPSIGERLAEHIADYIDTGKVQEWEILKKETGKDIHKLLQIEGIGPKKIKLLHQSLGISSIDDLKKAIQGNKLQSIKGFGEKSAQNILESIKLYTKRHERMFIDQAWKIAHEIINYLKKHTALKKIEIAGSLRRMKETIGDIDLLAITDKPKELIQIFVNMPDVERILGKGETKATVILKDGVQIDLRAIAEKNYGAALLYFTGNKDHNIALRKLANKKGYKLSEYGFENIKTGKIIAAKTEEDVYKKLGFEFIPPELRTNRDELELAKNNKLPNLISLEDIKGDLHMHTKYSDGINTIREMVKKAKSLGYSYIAITDHSKSEHIANGMDEKEIKKQWKEIDKISKEENFKILKGAEVNILKDGSLDYSEEILKQLDIVLVAIHSGFKSSKEAMTKRILKGVSNKYANIFVHPTGRIINKRNGYDADFDQIFKKCKENNVALEINSSPYRLDLNDLKIIQAKKYGVKFSIDTDSHVNNALENIRFGVGQARRGGLEKKDIINTKTYEQLKKFLKKQ